MEFVVAMIAGIVVVWVLKGLQRDQSRNAAGKGAKQCPHCREWVKAGATVCRYCQRDLPEEPKPASYSAKDPTPRGRIEHPTLSGVGWVVLGFAVLIGLGYLFAAIGG